MGATTYPPADRTQWFAALYPGSPITPDTLVIHTTEGPSWPGYDGGKKAPHNTARPDFTAKRLVWRQHFPFSRSSRALANPVGGVETNREDALQVELVGTCDPTHRTSWVLGDRTLYAGRDYIYWPDAPEWALRDLAAYIAWLHQEWGIPLTAPAVWLPYPSSYGTSRVRMSASAWLSFAGVCGHQHVPENLHGDPGNIAITHVLALAGSTSQEDDMPLSPADIDAVATATASKILGYRITRNDPRYGTDGVPAVQELADIRTAQIAQIAQDAALAAALAKIAEGGDLTAAQIEAAAKAGAAAAIAEGVRVTGTLTVEPTG